MLKALGFGIVVLGCTGFGYSYLFAQKESMKEMGRFIYFFKLLESEITYYKEPLPEAVVRVGKRMEKEMDEIFDFIENTCVRNKQMSFGEAWNISLQQYLQKTQLCTKEKNMLISFSNHVGYADKKLMESMMKQYIEEMDRYKKEKEDELSGKQKVVLGISTVLGLMISIILL